MKKLCFLMLVSISPPATTPKIALFFFMLVSISPPATQLEKVKKLFFYLDAKNTTSECQCQKHTVKSLFLLENT